MTLESRVYPESWAQCNELSHKRLAWSSVPPEGGTPTLSNAPSFPADMAWVYRRKWRNRWTSPGSCVPCAVMNRYFTMLRSPVGELMLTSDGEALTGLFMEQHAGGPVGGPQAGWKRETAPFREVTTQLQAYFEGEQEEFSLPLAAVGTDFQKRVWSALASIPFGETRSYGDVARQIGQVGASRAVGLANGQNPISIIVPCHRVIGANGTLTGYGGGLERKRWLLEHEGALVAK